MIKLIIISFILLAEFSESVPRIGHYPPEIMIWGQCGQNHTITRHSVEVQPKCHRFAPKGRAIRPNPMYNTSKTSVVKTRVQTAKKANRKEAPYAVRISFTQKKNLFKCSGTIISDWWILTAGQCANVPEVTVKEYYRIYYSGTDTNRAIEVRAKETAYLHYTDDQIITYHTNIGLIKVNERMDLWKDMTDDRYASAACFANKDEERNLDHPFVEFGWTIGYLLTAWHNLTKCQENSHLSCSKSSSGTTCPLDKGGPLVEYRNEKAFQLGVSVIRSEECSQRVFAQVGPSLDWINSIIAPEKVLDETTCRENVLKKDVRWVPEMSEDQQLGRTAQLHEAPYVGRIVYTAPKQIGAGNDFVCTGTIVAEHFILTTARCASGLVDQGNIITKKRKKRAVVKHYAFYYGSHDTHKSYIANIASTQAHPRYKPNDMRTFSYNIGLLRTTKPMRQAMDESHLLFTVNTPCLPDKTDRRSFINQTAVEYGWDKDFLITIDHKLEKCLTKSFVCSTTGGDLDVTCPTDAGGPLVQFTPDGKAVQIGLSLSGSADCSRSTFLLVRPHLKWIQETISAHLNG